MPEGKEKFGYFKSEQHIVEKVWENTGLKDINEYDKMHLIIDFVSGMTDSYAVMLYKKLLGISLPE